MSQTKTVALLSGGIDGATALYWSLDEGNECLAVSVDYGQRHRRELQAAEAISRVAGVPHVLVNAGWLGQLGRSSLTDGGLDNPRAHQEDASQAVTVVPARNTVLLSIGLAHAVALGYDRVVFGAHAGDRAIYPDCRPEYVKSMSAVGRLCDHSPVAVVAPLIALDKAGVVSLAILLDVPLDETWTCYEGRNKPCGQCGACRERREAFDGAGAVDPAEYEA